MSEDVTNFPLAWPIGRPRTKDHARERAKFNTRGQPLAVWVGIQRLTHELRLVHAERLVVSSNIPTRRDGLPMSKVAEPRDPGVAVYFSIEGEPRCISCDKWDRVADNIGAIALHVEAVRGQLRWGAGTVEQAFAGFKALPAVAQWWSTLGFATRPEYLTVVRDRFRELALKHHPDRGGNADRFAEISGAYQAAQAELA